MLKKLVTVMIVVCCASVASAGQVAKGQTFLSLGAGASLPISDFGDLANTGFLGSAGLEYWLSAKTSIGGEFNYNSYDASDIVQSLAPAGVDLSWSVPVIAVYAKYLLGYQSTAPYVKYSVGTYKLTAKASGSGASASASGDSDIGIAGGLGILFSGGGKLNGFAEVVYHNVFVDGGGFNFVNLSGGILIQLGGGGGY